MAVLSGYKIVSHDKIDSTSEEAMRLIKNGEAFEGLVITAKEQDSGHGKYGKIWESPKGNLYFSLIIKPDIEQQKVAQISFVTAVALGNVLAEFLPDSNIQYKWPNDILIDGKKISGILLEYISGWLVIGVGVNIDVTPDIDKPVTSIKLCGKNEIKPEILLEKVIFSLDNSLKLWKKTGFEHIREEWISMAFKHNEEITVNLPSEKLVGIFKGLDSEGNLELLIGNETRMIVSGEVFF